MIVEAPHPFRPEETLRFDTDHPNTSYRVELRCESELGLDFWANAYRSVGLPVPWEDMDLWLDGGL